MTMEIKVLYFASAREEVGLREEKLTLPRSSATLRELRRVLMDKHPQAAATIESITLARNLEYSDDDVALADGDEVALIPPISGGLRADKAQVKQSPAREPHDSYQFRLIAQFPSNQLSIMDPSRTETQASHLSSPSAPTTSGPIRSSTHQLPRGRTTEDRGPTSSGSVSRAPGGSFDGQAAIRAFLQLQELEAARVSKRARYHNDPLPTTEGDEDSAHPLLDTFRDSVGSDDVLKMTNFTPSEIAQVYGDVSDFMAARWNIGRGQSSKQTPVDVFFMTLCVLKNGGEWAVLAHSFGMKPAAFEKMIVHFLDLLSPHLYHLYVEEAASTYTMKKVAIQGHAFRHYPAVGVTFQQSNMPSASQADFYSAKHKLHGYKTELSVMPTGICINCSHHSRGGVDDMTIFRKNLTFHEAATTKSPSEESMADEGPYRDTYPSSWIIIADEGYQELNDTMRVLHPKRSRPTDPLTLKEEETNREISSDRTIVENYFGRLCTLWALVSDKYCWQVKKYEMYFRACVALTNVQVRVRPLRADDGEQYKDYLRRLNHIGTARRERRRESNQRAHAKRELQLATEVPPVPEDESD
ncbi:hypothetical protein PF004_g9736 [Phytophthora fragariae]|uniref:Molybdopterin synthase sulfur carrier subunit n=1 Tax=Phytophthora fragariae TaxID=53985 RepID=A0A6G0P3A5_9STRA|nr:hypothetical protein PF004_g9736 [Phytophthora fragariae]